MPVGDGVKDAPAEQAGYLGERQASSSIPTPSRPSMRPVDLLQMKNELGVRPKLPEALL